VITGIIKFELESDFSSCLYDFTVKVLSFKSSFRLKLCSSLKNFQMSAKANIIGGDIAKGFMIPPAVVPVDELGYLYHLCR